MPKGKKIMGFGTFDSLHPGHVFYLEALKKLGGDLIVVVARDRNVKRIKGHSPHFKEKQRLEAVKSLNIADQVILGNQTDLLEVIRVHQPDILGFGYDQQVDEKKLKEIFPTIKIRRFEAYFPKKFKSSIIKEQLGID